jgi:hypothetical protein
VLTVGDTGVKYEIAGDALGETVGKIVSVTGTIDPNQKPTTDTSAVLRAVKWTVVGASAPANKTAVIGTTISTKAIIAGTVVAAAGTGIGLGIAKANEAAPSASR